jgi:hypothetical protein
LYLGDSELKAILDLGTAGRAHAVTEGVVGAMRALEVVVFLNNSSMEEVVRVDALARELEATTKRIVELEVEVTAVKASTSKNDKLIPSWRRKLKWGPAAVVS